MSSAVASAERAAVGDLLRAIRRELDAFVLCASAVNLAMSIFVRRAATTPFEFPANDWALVTLVVLVQLLPMAVLWAADTTLRARGSRRHPRFRALLFGLPAAFLWMHGLGAVIDGGAYVEDPARIVLFVVLCVPLMWALPRLASRYPTGAATIYRFLLPAGLLPTVALFTGSGGVAPPLPAASLAAPVDEPLPTLFVLLFDELGYQAILGDDGSIDGARYPNLAAFASASAVFPDASAHHFRSVEAVPEIVTEVASLSEVSDVNLYLQYSGAEEAFVPDCGVRYECFGASVLSESSPDAVLTHYLVSLTWRATPGPLRHVVEAPRQWFASALGQPHTAVDWRGTHLFTQQVLNRFRDDVRGASPTGQVFVLHTMLSHFPYLYDGDGYLPGDANRDFWTPGVDPDETYENLRRHLEYTDQRLGELLAVLRENGRLDDSYVILTADHGIRRGDALKDEAPPSLPLEIASVPLIIHGPGIEPGEHASAYSHVDFGATLRDVMGLEPPSTGISAFAPLEVVRGAREFVIHSWTTGEEWHYERDAGEDGWHLEYIDEDPPEH